MTESERNRIIKLVQHEGLADTLMNLHDRWQDEREYEDWSEYRKVVERTVSEIDKKIVILKVTKRPIGFQFIMSGSVIKVFLNIVRNSFQLKATRVVKKVRS